eukprot:gene53168-12897_t
MPAPAHPAAAAKKKASSGHGLHVGHGLGLVGDSEFATVDDKAIGMKTLESSKDMEILDLSKDLDLPLPGHHGKKGHAKAVAAKPHAAKKG